MLTFAVTLYATGTTTPQAFAQTSTPPAPHKPVSMAWTNIKPLFRPDYNDAPSGLAVEFGYALGAEVGFDLAPYKVKDFEYWAQDQQDGTSQIIPMAARLPILDETNLFSNVVFTSEVRFVVPVENSMGFDPGNLVGRRIGLISPSAGSNPAHYPDATLVRFTNIRVALMALLSNEIDSLSTEASFVFAEANAARVGHRIAFVGAPVEILERVVVLHKSRAELLQPINEAIARMKADGRIDALRKAFQLRVPAAAPEVLRAPVAHLPPWTIVEGQNVSGFMAELVQHLAKRAGLEIAFEPVSVDA